MIKNFKKLVLSIFILTFSLVSTVSVLTVASSPKNKNKSQDLVDSYIFEYCDLIEEQTGYESPDLDDSRTMFEFLCNNLNILVLESCNIKTLCYILSFLNEKSGLFIQIDKELNKHCKKQFVESYSKVVSLAGLRSDFNFSGQDYTVLDAILAGSIIYNSEHEFDDSDKDVINKVLKANGAMRIFQ